MAKQEFNVEPSVCSECEQIKMVDNNEGWWTNGICHECIERILENEHKEVK